ncbi:MAG: AbrB/MazE/SpoVT family DNA-binding domain-containing protein [Gemmatimonadaceae bacterium]|jgi:AbrB family looped-hinge helix DNA binding protein|nr:AbrB/MazE/SpoVT family DNA-binding domain-containing protein [Gemmatimonadaceae bacterium]
MAIVTVSPQFHVVIPRDTREALRLRAGQKLQALQHHNRIELIPVQDMHDMRGFLRGIDTTVTREHDREQP